MAAPLATGITLAIRRVLACTACLFAIACGPQQLVSSPQEDTPEPTSNAATADEYKDFLRKILSTPANASTPPSDTRKHTLPVADISFFNQIVTFETVFPDPAERALYQMIPPDTVNGRYGYGFYLATQPGMNEARHYSVLSIVWEPAGTKELSEKLSGAAGPGGAFTEFVARTHDGLYDVRVTWSMLLPDTVDVDVDVHSLAEKMVQRYKHYAQESNQSSKGE